MPGLFLFSHFSTCIFGWLVHDTLYVSRVTTWIEQSLLS